MEIILSRRNRNIILGLLSSITLSILFFYIFHFDKNISNVVDKDIGNLKKYFESKVNKLYERSDNLFYLIKKKVEISEKDLNKIESLIFVSRGKIIKYYGNIYYFSIIRQDYKFVLNNGFLYFIRKFNKNLFYSCLINKFDNDFLKDFFKHEYYSRISVNNFKKSEINSANKNKYLVFNKFIKSLNLNLEVIIDKVLFNKFVYTNNFYLIAFILFLMLSVYLFMFVSYFRKHFNIVLAIFLFSLFFLSKIVFAKDFEINIFFFHFNSIIELIFLLLSYYYIIKEFLLKFKRKSYILILVFINLSLLYILTKIVLNKIRIDLSLFSFNFTYLSLVFLIFILIHLVAYPLFYLLKLNKNLFAIVFELLLIIFFIVIIFNINSINMKKGYVERFFKEAILNQNNYSKFLAREVVYEMNSNIKDFKILFKKDMRYTLEKIWKNTLLLKENNPSGIFVIDKEGNIVNSFSYKIPYIRTEKTNVFPFWAVYNTSAKLYGNTVNISVASIDIFDKEDYLGYIIINVLNSYDKLIFGINKNKRLIDKRFVNTDFNIIRIDENNNVIENTLNLNIENISDIVDKDMIWVKENIEGRKYLVYVFNLNNNKVLVLFRTASIFDLISYAFKLLLLCFIALFILNLFDFKVKISKEFINSFSFKVFLILLVLSIITSLVLIVFSINYNTRLSKLREKEILIESGTSVKNIVSDIIEARGEININDVYMISNLINNDLNVYENNILLYSSEYKNIYNNKYPIYLDSFVLKRLKRNSQRLIVEQCEDGLNLFFMQNNYVFNVLPSKSIIYRKRDLESFYNLLVDIFVLILFIALILSWFFRKRIVYPVNLLQRAMYDVKSGRNKKLDYIPKESEFKSIFTGFNSMLDGIEEQKKKISELSRMRTIVNLARRVAHEVKNPLTPIKLSAEQILKLINKNNIDKDMIIKAVNYIIEETEHLKKVSYGFLDLSRLDKLEIQDFNIKELFVSEISQMMQINSKIKIDFICDDSKDYNVKLDKTKIKQLIKNLLSNSIESIKDRGLISVNLNREKELLIISIKDDGKGISRNLLDKVFDKGFSTKDSGSGLGLYIVKRIVDMHFGKIEIYSENKKGTEVIIRLPVVIKNIE